MLVYKYVSFSGGKSILSSLEIGYSNPWDFNDPFEMGAAHELLPNFASAPSVLRSMFERNAILSLTRSPLNPLMWAHYATSHTGFVIGWDAKAAGFCDPVKNLIPVQHGDVTYTTTRPISALLGESAPMRYGQEFSYRPELMETLKRYFLNKAMCWCYEEEVRVVKCVCGNDLSSISSGPLRCIQFNNRPLFLAPFPRTAIKEVYLGICNPIVAKQETADVIKPWMADVKVYECRMAPNKWSMTAIEFEC